MTDNGQLIRAFSVDVLAEAETEMAYVGLGLHLGTPVSQNAAGDLLGHVRDTGVVRDSPAVRLYATSQRQDFHCDGSDLVGLLCLKPAKTGGESKIVSSMAVFNEMLASRPSRSSSTSTVRPGSSSSAGTSAMRSATSRRRG